MDPTEDLDAPGVDMGQVAAKRGPVGHAAGLARRENTPDLNLTLFNHCRCCGLLQAASCGLLQAACGFLLQAASCGLLQAACGGLIQAGSPEGFHVNSS